MSNYQKSEGYRGEDIALQDYLDRGYTLVKKNFTIPGGEVDLIVQDQENLIFVEVKTVNFVNDLGDYITPMKLSALERTIQTYLYKHETTKHVRLDIIFVKHGTILEKYEDVEV